VHAIAKALDALPSGHYLLAVSGGRDSMALLHAFAARRRADLSAVATFDHGTGTAATAAVALVIDECLVRGISVVAGRTPAPSANGYPSESRLRDARWAFLRAVAAERRAVIVTAHTRDDQAETVAQRILRDASARGLAAMAARSAGVVRPVLGIGRADLAEYAQSHGVRFIEDPSNDSAAYQRNRLRADLLVAAERVHPGFRDELVAIGDRAAGWRAELASLAESIGPRRVGDALVIDAAALDGMSAESLAVLWPELAGRVDVVMDRRGLERVASWSRYARPGQRVPLSGGASIERTARTFVLRGASPGS